MFGHVAAEISDLALSPLRYPCSTKISLMYRVLVFRRHPRMCSFAKIESVKRLEIDWVRFSYCSIIGRLILFDWQNVWMSSVMFDCRTQSTIEIYRRIGAQVRSITKRSIDYTRYLLPSIGHNMRIPSLSLDGIVKLDIFNFILIASCTNKVYCNTNVCFHIDWLKVYVGRDTQPFPTQFPSKRQQSGQWK